MLFSSQPAGERNDGIDLIGPDALQQTQMIRMPTSTGRKHMPRIFQEPVDSIGNSRPQAMSQALVPQRPS